jgi:hypothetical protein
MSTPKQVRYSRWRRLPGVHRITEQRIPDHRAELQRLTLYLPGAVLDQAEILAARAGAANVQAYCEDLLRYALELEAARDRESHDPAARVPFLSLDALENDPDYLAEWTASATHPARPSLGGPSEPEVEYEAPPALGGALAGDGPAEEPSIVHGTDPSTSILRHAAIGPEDPSAFLPTLRRGEPIHHATAEELLRALLELERSLVGQAQIDRRLAYALHRLAFEGQVLLTDAWPNVAADQATVDVLRMVQEAVDRTLSGEDIRYYARGPEAGPAP